jgi:hypothetical protein
MLSIRFFEGTTDSTETPPPIERGTDGGFWYSYCSCMDM